MKNDSVNVINEIYKPYRLTKKNNVTILESTSGKFVLKPKGKKNIKELYTYLISRSFKNFPPLVDGDRDEVNLYEYIEETQMPKEQKIIDLIHLVSSLHNKTTFFKEVSTDKYQEVFENIYANTEDVKDFYSNMITKAEARLYMAPSEYMLVQNSTKIFEALDFCKNELLEWYELVKDKKKERVCLVHNNLDTSHYIKGEDDYLVSWEKSTIDTPILDFINFYRSEYLDYDFSEVLEAYMKKYPLNEDEKKLLFVVIVLPEKYELSGSELSKCLTIQRILDYVFKTEDLVRPYYSKKDPVEE